MFWKKRILTIFVTLYVLLLIVDNELLYKTPYMINYYVLALIIAFMLVSRGLELSGIFNHIVVEFLSYVKKPSMLFILLFLIAGLSASIIMNDTALFIYVPLVTALTKTMNKVDKSTALTLLTISVNIGSALTPIGNPQNIIIWQVYGISFHDLVRHMIPFVTTSLGVAVLFTYLLLRKNINSPGMVYKPPKIYLNNKLLYVSITLLVTDLVAAQTGHIVFGFIATILAYVVIEKGILLGIDYELIVIFAFMFIDFKELSKLLHEILVIHLSNPYTTLLVAALLSQVISNVPTTIMLTNHVDNWLALAIGVNIGGTGFIIGSLANVITLRLGKVKIRKFLKINILYFITILTLFYILAYVKIYP